MYVYYASQNCKDVLVSQNNFTECVNHNDLTLKNNNNYNMVRYFSNNLNNNIYVVFLKQYSFNKKYLPLEFSVYDHKILI